MRNNLLRNFIQKSFFVLLLAVIGAGAFSVAAQKRPANSKTPQTKSTIAENNETLQSEPSNPAMSGVWESGQLPQPLAVPSGNDDEAMAILAQKVIGKTEESIPAFLTALQLSGFFVTNQDGSVFLAPADGKGQGLTVNGWEVASAAKMFGDGRATSLFELNERLKSIPALKDTQPAMLMMQGVRANAENTQNKYLRAWARFILALGKTNAAPNGIRAEPNEAGEAINAIQHLLLFRRLYGDLFARSMRYRMESNSFGTVEPDYQTSKLPRFYGASVSSLEETIFPAQTENVQLADTTDQKAIPCKMEGNAPTVMDASATLIGFGYSELMGYLEDVYQNTPTGTAIEKASKFQAVANIILAYAKFIQSYAALEVTLTLEGAPPLVRTKNAAPGERKNMSAAVRINIGNWQMYNCIRTALNVTAGLDFATLNDGPIGDVGVTWHLDKGGAGDEYSNRTGVNRGVEQIVGFTKEGAIRIQDKGTTIANSPNVRYGKTDSNGVTKVILEGSPQKNAKTYKAKPVMKEAVVRTTIKLKAGEIKGDMVDVSGQALGGIAGLITMPTELLYRVSWASSGTLTVPVKDWEDCTGGWTGTITATTKYKKTQTDMTSGRLIEAITIKERTETVTYQLTGEQDRSGGLMNGFFADATVEYSESSFAKNVYKGTFTCDTRRMPNGTETQTYEQKASATGDGRVTVYISAVGQTGSLLSSNSIQAVGDKWFSQTYKTGCALNDYTNTKPWYKDKNPLERGGSTLSIDIEIDPKNADMLSGVKTVKNSDGSETVYNWSLTYCR